MLKLTYTEFTEQKWKLESGSISTAYKQTDVQLPKPLKIIPLQSCCYERKINRFFDFNKNDILSDLCMHRCLIFFVSKFRVEVLRPSQPNGVMSSAVSLPNHTFTGQA